MLFLARPVKFVQCCFCNSTFRLLNMWSTSHNNLIDINNNITTRKYSNFSDISVTDSAIKKYIDSILGTYTMSHNRNSELIPIIQLRQVTELLENRLQITENIKNLEELGRHDEEMKALGHDEYITYQNDLIKLDKELIDMILDNMGRDDCNDIIFEITAGVGGQEAMLFTANLYEMYQKHFEYLGFDQQPIELSVESALGSLRHASILVSGVRSFELLRHEGGVHRVQRIPATEKSSRMHTSTASVVVLPQPNEVEVNLQDSDLKIETKRSSGAGGQSVNTTDSAVRITHLPTGVMVEAQSERSQIQNKKIAMIKLRTKIYNLQLNEQKSSVDLLRKKQRGMCQRNEKIRTYNYSQDRITDHRLTNGTMHNLKGFMEGGERLENLQERLQKDFQLKLLRESMEKCK